MYKDHSAVLEVGGDRLGHVATSQRIKRLALPHLSVAPIVLEPDIVKPSPRCTEQAASLDLGELREVAAEHHFAPTLRVPDPIRMTSGSSQSEGEFSGCEGS